jgi:hypothetical protein
MAGFSNFTTNQATQTTTMPSWYDKAQQDLVTGATAAGIKVPALADTVAGSAISQLDGTGTNPFTQAQGTLNQISAGAANPWITDIKTGQVTPNTSTALGGLFQAQNQQLNQLAPDLMAVPTAAGTASGQFGSLRTQTAANKALADAQSKLFADQMQAALQNQQTGATAAANLGNVAEKGINTATTLGQTQQADPLLASSALAKIIGSLQVGTTQKNTTQLSPLQQIAAIASALGGSVAGTNKLLQDLNIKGGLPELFKGVTGGNIFGNTGAGTGGQTSGPVDFNANPAPPGVLDETGQPNPGYFQDEAGNWYGPDSNSPINAGGDTGFSDDTGGFDFDFGNSGTGFGDDEFDFAGFDFGDQG